jgi:polyketide synthase PksN
MEEAEGKPDVQNKQEEAASLPEDLLRDKTVSYLKSQVSAVIKLSADRIEADAPMEKYGIDSIMSMKLVNQLEKTFGSLPKTLFFEYQNIVELAEYFMDGYKNQLVKLFGTEKKAQVTAELPKKPVFKIEPQKTIERNRERRRFSFQPDVLKEEKTSGAFDIAIIGISGKYPMARNLDEFWENLRNGRDCITEVPKERWDHSLYYDEDKDKIGKSYSKWGGFIEGVDRFDPLFFNISPRDAVMMDPQERLFLECVYSVLEEAGYTRDELNSRKDSGINGDVGVFVGVMYEEYQLYGAQAAALGMPFAVPGNPASIANRVSYFCNFHGPSMAVDTMCSSSLTSIHLACQSLLQGGCKMAIAGGVNVSIHPNKYLLLAQGKYASSKGRCESFGIGGDGYVPGEGVGAVLLKPLSKAVEDKDHIYGVIKASVLNHGGKTNGYTVPNPNAQAELISRTLKEAGINPRTISYIEAHGTGTSLGDPIEISGLSKAFSEYTKDKQFCAIGSAKSNIGHCESAAGIAGVTKVLLQMKHRQIVPSLHSSTLNPYIDFENTPFIVQQKLTEWKRPYVEIDGQAKEYPRIAGISAFGAGGSNAHIIIEEYIPESDSRDMSETGTEVPALIVLSAKNEDRLRERAQQLLDVVRKRQYPETALKDMAFTLQVGREAMDERLAVIVESFGELEDKLNEYIEGKDGIEGLYRGQSKRNKEAMSVFLEDEDLTKTISSWIEKGKYSKLLDIWTKGVNFDWKSLYGSNQPCRISLPT